MTISQASVHFNVPRRTLRNWIGYGWLPAERLPVGTRNGLYLVRPADVVYVLRVERGRETE